MVYAHEEDSIPRSFPRELSSIEPNLISRPVGKPLLTPTVVPYFSHRLTTTFAPHLLTLLSPLLL